MKQIIKYLSALFIFYACDSLDLTPEDYYGSGSFWNNSSQVEGFMLGLHNDLRSTDRSVFNLGEARGGTSVLGATALGTSIINTTPIKDNNFTKDNTGISNWNGYYSKILQVNIFIGKVENECSFLSDTEKSYFLGQAYGLRAFYYFILYRTYGGVPVIDNAAVLNGATNAQDLYTKRSTAKETLSFIKEDINKSESYFASSTLTTNPKSLWSSDATLMLKGEIYLWSAKVTTQDQIPSVDDIQIAKKAISSLINKYSLCPNFEDVFSCINKGNDEIIFTIRYLEGEATSWAWDFVYPNFNFVDQVYGRDGIIMGDTLDAKSTGYYFNAYKFELFESYDSMDMRRDATFLDFYMKDENKSITGKGLILRKFMGIINSTNNRIYVSDIPIYRYAETLLLMAEIENKLGNNPAQYINEVRKRAYGLNFNPEIHEYKDLGYSQNELAILKERDKEFVWEGKRWYDVCRMQDAEGKPLVFSTDITYGSTQPILNFDSEAHKLLWPIDVNTLNNDPLLEQTPGYE
ncbi:RagB/SusD family nutrient uptake outer membrane protein [Massilibacteroides vaginae]|uniref:RagB/SusD family nutrient uptake outer membrane protein n=1 Tax=Massilibacteroides vaginae TaxID=1673718 RepID=UPI000A1C82C2|nr:RagB/SusD family nutrient uptake outer membrane protein [Massilibacteroides vaginae]